MSSIHIATSCSNGLEFHKFSSNSLVPLKRLSKEQIKAFAYSDDGTYFCISYDSKFEVYEVNNFKLIHTIQNDNISKAAISPKNNIMIIFEHYREGPNLKFIDFKTGKIIKEVVQQDSGLWKPQWTSDDRYAVRFSQGVIHLYTDNNFESTSDQLKLENIYRISLNDSPKNPLLAVALIGKKNEPSFIRIYSIDEGKFGAVQLSKTFFGSDQVGFSWSLTGNELIVLATKTESTTSYYGEQNLFFLSARKGETCMINLPRPGAIYDIKWVPKGQGQNKTAAGNKGANQNTQTHFAICHGHMPSSINIFGLDCEVKYSFCAAGSFNFMSFNPQGNLILLAGFGNIPGNMSVWDFQKRTRLSAISCPDATSFGWLDDGEHVVAATTTPKLRVNNGFSIYKYNGEEVVRWNVEKREVPRPATMDLPARIYHELYHVLCQPLPKDCIPPPVVPVKGIINVESLGNQKSQILAKSSAYVPPSFRNNDGGRKTDIIVGGVQKLDIGANNQNKPNNKNKKKSNPDKK